MNALDVFVLSSRSEGFPNVVGEAMATARPCVVTDVGDAAALLGTTGRVVPARDPAALAAAIVELLALSSEERRNLGQAARARLIAEFSLQRTVERFTALQHSVVDAVRKQASAHT